MTVFFLYPTICTCCSIQFWLPLSLCVFGSFQSAHCVQQWCYSLWKYRPGAITYLVHRRALCLCCITETVDAPVASWSGFCQSICAPKRVKHLANATKCPAACSFAFDMDFHSQFQHPAVFWRPINRIPAWFYSSFLFLVPLLQNVD